MPTTVNKMFTNPVLFGSFQLPSFVRSHHVYKAIWTPSEGQVLQLQREPSNPNGRFAVVVCLDGEIVGRVPVNIAPMFSPMFSQFLARGCNTITATVTGARDNRGTGLGLDALLLYAKQTKMLCAKCKGTSDQFKLISLLFKLFADMILLICHCVSKNLVCVPAFGELLSSIGWYSERLHSGEYII